MQRLEQLFQQKKNILSIYFTAGYPKLDDTTKILASLSEAGVDLVELGMPYSDPLADGPTIQMSSTAALAQGLTLDVLFEQVEMLRKTVHLPIMLMGYYNQLLQYGPEAFFARCAAVGIDGLIVPDLPLQEYKSQYQSMLERYDLGISFLITPQTSEARIREIDRLSRGFVYVVSDAATTGASLQLKSSQLTYFQRLKNMQLQNPMLIGFGIHDAQSFQAACCYASGAIVGSAFVRALGEAGSIDDKVSHFVQQIREEA